MRKCGKRWLFAGVSWILLFGIWTILLLTVDVQPIGQGGTPIGLARLNRWFHEWTGVSMIAYQITDWLGLVPVLICAMFGMLGFCQMLKRRSFFKVDADLVDLGVYYTAVILCYCVFEWMPVNYRPVLIEGVMEASYPSSTTLLVVSVMLSVVFQVNRRTENARVRNGVFWSASIFAILMVVGRLLSGVHWLTDIVGALLLGAGLFCTYKGIVLLG